MLSTYASDNTPWMMNRIMVRLNPYPMLSGRPVFVAISGLHHLDESFKWVVIMNEQLNITFTHGGGALIYDESFAPIYLGTKPLRQLPEVAYLAGMLAGAQAIRYPDRTIDVFWVAISVDKIGYETGVWPMTYAGGV